MVVALQRRLEALLDLHQALSNGNSDESTLGQLQSTLEALLSLAQGQVRGLDKQLDRLSRASAIVKKETVERKDALSPGESGPTEDDNPAKMEVDEETAASQSDSPQVKQEEGNNEEETTNKQEEVEDESSKHSGASNSPPEAVEESAATVDAETRSPSSDPGSSGSPGSTASAHITEATATGKKKEFVHNPRSEFVDSQELPIAALGLFNEKDATGDDSMKKKLGVVSYPTVDLQEMLPGPIPMDDFTHAKPANQVQSTTYQTFLEPYFRPFTEEDLSLLESKTVGAEVVSFGRTISPYVIPPLGPQYLETWAEEDHTSVPEAVARASAQDAKRFEAMGAPSDILDPSLEQGTIGLGPFTARLMAALMPEDIAEEDDETGSGPPEPPSGSLIPPPSIKAGRNVLFHDFSGLEERLKREFRYVGILDINILRKYEKAKRQFKLALPSADGENSTAGGKDESSEAANGVGDGDLEELNTGDFEIDWANGTEDDEICREIRYLQGKLKQVSANNLNYKRRLLPHVQELMAWQEYSTILADLDKQVDQAYIRRLKVPKAKKKAEKEKEKERLMTPMSPMPGASSNGVKVDHKPAVRALLDKRQRWISKIGGVFKPPYLMMRSHEEPKFEGYEEEEEEEEEEE